MQDALRANMSAGIVMFARVINQCPSVRWQSNDRFYLLCFHTLIFLDFYSTWPVKHFKPVLPYHLADIDKLPAMAVDDVAPNSFYSKTAMIDGLKTIHARCQKFFAETSLEELQLPWIEAQEIEMHGLCPPIAEDYSILEIVLYNLRHLQHHIGQLNMLLASEGGGAVEWVAQADSWPST